MNENNIEFNDVQELVKVYLAKPAYVIYYLAYREGMITQDDMPDRIYGIIGREADDIDATEGIGLTSSQYIAVSQIINAMLEPDSKSVDRLIDKNKKPVKKTETKPAPAKTVDDSDFNVSLDELKANIVKNLK